MHDSQKWNEVRIRQQQLLVDTDCISTCISTTHLCQSMCVVRTAVWPNSLRDAEVQSYKVFWSWLHGTPQLVYPLPHQRVNVGLRESKFRFPFILPRSNAVRNGSNTTGLNGTHCVPCRTQHSLCVRSEDMSLMCGLSKADNRIKLTYLGSALGAGAAQV